MVPFLHFRVIGGHRPGYVSKGGPGHSSEAWTGDRVSCGRGAP